MSIRKVAHFSCVESLTFASGSIVETFKMPNGLPGSIFGTLKGLSPDFWFQKTQTLGLTRDPPESKFQIVNTDNVDYIDHSWY